MKTTPEIGWFGLGLTGLAFGVLVAGSFPKEGQVVEFSRTAVTEIGSFLKVAPPSLAQQVAQNPTLQQMINSGRLDPPPGNTSKMYSIASPFNHSAQSASTGVPPSDAGMRQDQSQRQVNGSTISFNRGDTSVITSTSQVIQSTNSQTQTSSQSAEFDTPPGIGSSTGGR